MIDRQLRWRQITTRREAAVLKNFTCTTDLPRTPGGRKLKHPRPWEWEAQRHLRQADQQLTPGDVLLLGEEEHNILAAIHVQFDATDTLLAVYLAAGAVTIDVRRQGGIIADEMLAEVHSLANSTATDRSLTHVVLTGKIHVANHASQRMVERAGFEPVDLPAEDYQTWSLRLR